MNEQQHEEMTENLNRLIREQAFQGKKIYLFGHCSASEELADALLERGLETAAFLDNNKAKQGRFCRGIEILPPEKLLEESSGKTCVCTAARAYAAMKDQLRRMGYDGQICRLVNYNSYAEYSLSPDTAARMRRRAESGMERLRRLEREHPGRFKILCPFPALGDVYIMMSYLPLYLKKRGIEACVIGVVGKACGETAGLFGPQEVEIFAQKDMDETIQAALFTGDRNVLIAHQDRPYVVNLSRALHIKKIPLEQLYCCGVFGLPASAEPVRPSCLRRYGGIEEIKAGKAVIFAPHAKSVAALPEGTWESAVNHFKSRGYQCFTNVAGREKPLPGTLPVSPSIFEMQSAAERAGTFVGIRSGLCDVLRETSCRKIALYPDYNYCDTGWKAVDMYRMEGWENIVVSSPVSAEENFPSAGALEQGE